MVKDELRQKIANEGYTNSVFYDCQSYDDSIIGVDVNGKVVYIFNNMIDEYIHDNYPEEFKTQEQFEDACTSAIEWIDYNTIRATPYATSLGIPPIIIDYNPESESIYDVISGEEYDLSNIVMRVEDKYNEYIKDIEMYK